MGKPVFVAAGADATGTEHHGPREGTHLDFKVLTKDTQAGFFLVEHRNVPQGGPVRHLHYAQEEWFYLIEGNKVRFIEVTTGITGEADIEVTSGVKAGMEIVRGPSRVLKTLKDGMTVKRQTKKPGANANEGS